MPTRPVRSTDVCYHQLKDAPPNVAILPWGATEAHGQHLPFGTDVLEAEAFAVRSATLAANEGANVIVYPPIPFGNNAQQLDQIATIHLSTTTANAILKDVAHSLSSQGIDRLIVLNSHGGNEFKPIIRDLQNEFNILIVLVNFYQIEPELLEEIFDEAGDHAGEMETSLMLHLNPSRVHLEFAGDGARAPFQVSGLNQSGVWTPRPWRQSHPDFGAGNPAAATAEKGSEYFEKICLRIKEIIVGLSKAEKGELPYI